ncbi:MAG: DNA repair protein RecN [Propionibacteriaceae bacterium]|jgi:DNA repair protein RecN (Recombination protein N)|nr:DNA repair protein RecN [Propionibacteriaceae bacterium]
MLDELGIRGLGVIEEATLQPGPGLTVVTGETGAGKTMVVSGLGLVAGHRADSTVVRHRRGLAQVEARFTDPAPETSALVEAAGGVIEDGELLVARQVSATGRSRSWVGGTAVTQAKAQDIGAGLVTIHGQSEQIRLSTPERQRQVLDRAAGPEMASLLDAYRAAFEERRTLAAELTALQESARERVREADMLAFGLAEIEKAGLTPGEDASLAEEAKRLQDCDELRVHAYTAMVALAGDDADLDAAPVLTLLATAKRALHDAAHRDPAAAVLASAADEVAALATELAGATSTYLADLVADPLRLEWIETRLAELKTLTRKYGPDVAAVLAWAADAGHRLADLEGSDERAQAVAERLGVLDAELARLAGHLTSHRTAAAADFGARVAGELAALAMPHARVEFAVTPLTELGPWGADAVALLFTANPGSEPAPLGRVASGGELSRVRLAIEVVLADARDAPTFVFDEVDAGIGGAVGLQVGLRLARLATIGQVIVVTHLAQVAAFADTHYVVAKADDGEVTAAGLTRVEGPARLAEIARMMGGLEASESSAAHAGELLGEARAMVAEARQNR